VSILANWLCRGTKTRVFSYQVLHSSLKSDFTLFSKPHSDLFLCWIAFCAIFGIDWMYRYSNSGVHYCCWCNGVVCVCCNSFDFFCVNKSLCVWCRNWICTQNSMAERCQLVSLLIATNFKWGISHFSLV